MASFSVFSIQETSFSISVTGISSGDSVWIVVRLASDPAGYVYNQTYTATSTFLNKTISGLAANTDYVANVQVNESGWIGAKNVTTESEPEPTVEPWDWFATSARRAAYNAVMGNGLVSDFSYTVWNEMVDKVYEVLQAKGYRWDSSFASLSATYLSGSDRTLTAARFNSLRYNVGSRYSTGISEVSTGDPVYGRYFTTLMDAVNSWIDS